MTFPIHSSREQQPEPQQAAKEEKHSAIALKQSGVQKEQLSLSLQQITSAEIPLASISNKEPFSIVVFPKVILDRFVV